jgi:hypothetical protein
LPVQAETEGGHDANPYDDRSAGTGAGPDCEVVMLTAVVLVCSIAATPNLRDCDASNARMAMRVPETYASPAACAMQGQAYIAETAIGRNLGPEDRVKVVCMLQSEADEALATLSNR